MPHRTAPYQKTHWTQEELNGLADLLGDIPPSILATVYNRQAVRNGWARRSPRALQDRASFIGFSTIPTGAWLRLTHVSRILQCHHQTVRDWLNAHKIPSITSGRACYLRRADLVDFAKRQPDVLADRPRAALFELFGSDELVAFILSHQPRRKTYNQRVRCLQSGMIYESIAKAAAAFYCHPNALYNAISRGRHVVVGRPFELLSPQTP